MNIYKLNLSPAGTLALPSSLQIVFLCGVKFPEGDAIKEDKRNVLQDLIASNPQIRVVILEKHFGKPSAYGKIGLRNLHDVETLVGYFANATIVIHESLSTAAEIGMLASNKSTAERTAVLYPDLGSVEEEKISGFISLAYYGESSVLPSHGKTTFVPALRKNHKSNDRYNLRTYLPSDFNRSYPYDNILQFLKQPEIKSISHIAFHKLGYKTNPTTDKTIVDYQHQSQDLTFYISPDALKPLIISVLSLDEVKSAITHCTSYIQVLSLLDEWLRHLLINSIIDRLKSTPQKTAIFLKGVSLTKSQNDENTSDYRKALGMLVYVLQAIGFLSVEQDGDENRFVITKSFTKSCGAFADIRTSYEMSKFAEDLEAL